MDGYGYESGLRYQIVSGKSSYGWSERYGSDVGAIPGEVTRSSHSGAAVGKPWSFGDPEAKRKKRIARCNGLMDPTTFLHMLLEPSSTWRSFDFL
ncbi:hypothetical protein Lalb_Chr02g0146641 [Lupinus albus]|uniref:Uncharacterized protein n=1 Tax=Lupinus albus TaxID=3870 RepID=A0A6A4QVD0_LUPAL|nr:hypothetical protein Lalb_Chr02g0146641 [Lupinus albus]